MQLSIASMDTPSPEALPNDLAKLAAGGCAVSFDHLQKRYWSRLQHVVQTRLALNTADCEDVCQETFVRAFQRISEFDPRYQFSTWLFTIGLRIGKDFLRKQRSRGRSQPLDNIERHPSGSVSQRSTAADAMEVEELWSVAKYQLPPEQYLTLWLRYGEELSILEIATVLQRTQISVRVILHRARTRLSAELESISTQT